MTGSCLCYRITTLSFRPSSRLSSNKVSLWQSLFDMDMVKRSCLRAGLTLQRAFLQSNTAALALSCACCELWHISAGILENGHTSTRPLLMM